MNPTAWETYFGKFVTLGVVNSMYLIDLLDLDTATKDLKSSHYAPDHLVLESFTVGTAMANPDQIYDLFTGAVLVLSPAQIRLFDQSAKSALLSKTYHTAALIKRTMIRDKYDRCDFTRGLDVRSMQIEKIGPVLDNLYGWRLQFSLMVDLNDPLQ
jgi:hypothetical protein